MIKIVPDKEGKLTQWDLNRKVIVTGYEGVAEVHFASPGDDHGAYVVKLVDGQAEIPNILLTMAGTINVYLYPADRTVFATTLWVMAREKPDDYIYTETEVLDWRRLDEKIGDLTELTTTAKENLVAAINEAATKGMASIYMRVEEGYIEYSGDGVNWKQLIAVAELKGEKGDPGSDATVDIVSPTAESTDTQAASAKAVWDMIGGGGSGTDISIGITGASVGDIIKVKTVDDNGKPTAWEAATAKLANPNALTFTGAVTGSYDGSAPLSVEIPSGGGGYNPLRLIKTVTLAETVKSITVDMDNDGDAFSLSEIYIMTNATNSEDQTAATNVGLDINGKGLGNIGTTSPMNFVCGKTGESGRNWIWLMSLNPLRALHGVWVTTNTASGKTVQCWQPNELTSTNLNPYSVGEKITSIDIYGTSSASYLAAGSQFRIYGR